MSAVFPGWLGGRLCASGDGVPSLCIAAARLQGGVSRYHAQALPRTTSEHVLLAVWDVAGPVEKAPCGRLLVFQYQKSIHCQAPVQPFFISFFMSAATLVPVAEADDGPHRLCQQDMFSNAVRAVWRRSVFGAAVALLVEEICCTPMGPGYSL